MMFGDDFVHLDPLRKLQSTSVTKGEFIIMVFSKIKFMFLLISFLRNLYVVVQFYSWYNLVFSFVLYSLSYT